MEKIEDKNIKSDNWFDIYSVEDYVNVNVYTLVCRFTGQVKRQTVQKFQIERGIVTLTNDINSMVMEDKKD